MVARLSGLTLDPLQVGLHTKALGYLTATHASFGTLVTDCAAGTGTFDKRLAEYRLHEYWLGTVEGMPMPALERFDVEERRLTRFCQQLATEIGAATTDWVVTRTAAGYASSMYFPVIQVPSAEATSLIDLATLAHEIGHSVFETHRKGVEDEVDKVLNPYVDSVTASIPAASNHDEHVSNALLLKRQWKNWAKEFFCDFLAAYTCGSAFGTELLRLMTRSAWDGPGFGDIGTHPAAALRVEATAAFLERLGQAVEVADLRTRLAVVEAAVGGRPANHTIAYPTELLDVVAGAAIAACSVEGIRKSTDPALGTPDVRQVLLEAAHQFVTSTDYATWEAPVLAKLWADLGV